MDIRKFITIVQIISAVLMIITILMQQQGADLSGMFGGSGDVYRTKRGMEKFLFYATIVLAVIFLGSGIAALFF